MTNQQGLGGEELVIDKFEVPLDEFMEHCRKRFGVKV